ILGGDAGWATVGVAGLRLHASECEHETASRIAPIGAERKQASSLTQRSISSRQCAGALMSTATFTRALPAVPTASETDEHRWPPWFETAVATVTGLVAIVLVSRSSPWPWA